MGTGYRCVLIGTLLVATCGFGVSRHASYRFADMTGADLSHRRLSGANLSSADLQSADLRNCDLRRADLSSACLLSADLRGADLRGANLTCANLSDANLRGARLENARFPGAMYSDETRWPSGFTPARRPAQYDHNRRGPGARYFVFPHPRTPRQAASISGVGDHASALPTKTP